jgi:hypothetical protein
VGGCTRRTGLASLGLCLVMVSSGLALLGCGVNGTEPSSGSLEITTVTSGADPDPDGYVVAVDNQAGTIVPANTTMQLQNLGTGDHQVQIADIAPNCALTGENIRRVSIIAGKTATVGFQIDCSPPEGSLEITTITSGSSPDPDGYIVTLNGKNRLRIAASATATFPRLRAGTYLVGLSNVAGNCQVQGETPQAVTVSARSMVAVSIEIDC